jgi:hypothetical protein
VHFNFSELGCFTILLLSKYIVFFYLVIITLAKHYFRKINNEYEKENVKVNTKIHSPLSIQMQHPFLSFF